MSKIPKMNLMWLTVNRGCNFRCEWCYAAGSEYRTEDEMSLSFTLDLLKIAKQLEIKRLFLIGGEPTLWPHLFDFNDAMKSSGIRSTLVTNTYRFSSDKFWEEYLKHPNTNIGASFKAFDPESLVENTKSTGFNDVTKSLRRVFKYQPKSIASFVYSQPYTSHFLDMVKYAMDCGAFGVSVNFCSPAIHKDHVDDKFMVDIDVLVKEIMSAYEEAHKITGGHLVFVMKHPLCIWPKEFIQTLKNRGQISTTCHLQHQSGGIIDTDGSLLICNSMSGFPVGKYGQDFNSAESLAAFFESEQMKNYFAQAKAYPSKKCISCEVFENCSGGCLLLWTVYQPDSIIKGW
ncbi:MAG: radical SAM protein [Candidatus Pacebacteria bacterium]|nr:radical SAM protein [Candidatus Paceibacterota bacterium]